MNRRLNIRQVAVLSGCILFYAVAPAATDAGTAPDSFVPAGLLSRATILSSDRVFAISAPPPTLGYRGPVLYFVDQFRKEFQRTTKLALGPVKYPITILLGSSTNDLRVTGTCSAMAGGDMQELIEVPDPEHANMDLLRTALVQAMVREVQRSWPSARDHPPPMEPPAWLLAGMARHIGAGTRPTDFDSVHAQWRSGRLPLLTDLLSADPPTALQHPALPAVLSAWLLDHPDAPLVALLRRLADGTPWSAELVAKTLYAQRTNVSLNEAWDAWQVSSMREIRQLGVTTPELVRAFRAQLLIYPGDHGLPMAESWRGRPLEECLAWPATPAVKNALLNKARAIRIYSAGRDGALQRVTVAYAALLEAAAAGEAKGKLHTMLEQAEEARRKLETRAQQGELLRDPVAETASTDRHQERK
ncbi:MAG: hypothetical protein ACOYOU_14865 [Kiritimatiellia bacterium]